MRAKEVFKLYLRSMKSGEKVWYLAFYDAAGHRQVRSMGALVKKGESIATSKALATARAKEVLNTEKANEKEKEKCPLLEEYAATFFKWGECSWIKRQLAKKRPFNSEWARQQHAYPTLCRVLDRS